MCSAFWCAWRVSYVVGCCNVVARLSNWKGSFTGEEVQNDPDQQHCFVLGSLALCCWYTLPPIELCFPC